MSAPKTLHALTTTHRIIEISKNMREEEDITDSVLPLNTKVKTIKSPRNGRLGVLSEDGEVFSWNTNTRCCTKLIKRTEKEHVIQLEMGTNFFVALTNTKRVFIWGTYMKELFAMSAE